LFEEILNNTLTASLFVVDPDSYRWF